MGSSLIENVAAGAMVEKAVGQISSFFKWVLLIDETYPIEKDVRFYLCSRTVTEPIELCSMGIEPFERSGFNAQLKTIFVIHGWTDHREREIIVDLRKALVKHLDVNVITADWGRLASQLYFHAADSTHEVGVFVAKFIQALITETNINMDDIHLIGHSLGAQISGIAGCILNGKLGRITGLDPAGPLFEFLYIEKPKSLLDKHDAQFVDIIHTASNDFGISDPAGHVDFYPNDGISPQPGCNTPIVAVSCSHVRSVEFFIESLDPHSKKFLAAPCDSWLSRVTKKCPKGQIIEMGYHVSKEANGAYYLLTAPESPFALDEDGIKFI